MTTTNKPDPAADAVFHLQTLLTQDRGAAGLTPADNAELRRMDPAHGPLPPAMWRLLTAPDVQPFVAGPVGRERRERALAVVARVALDAAPLGRTPVGQALADRSKPYSEDRFTRLLRARGLHDVAFEARLAARWCGVHGLGVQMAGGRGSFGGFILAAALDERGADQRAHSIARDFYHQSKQGDAGPTAPPVEH